MHQMSIESALKGSRTAIPAQMVVEERDALRGFRKTQDLDILDVRRPRRAPYYYTEPGEIHEVTSRCISIDLPWITHRHIHRSYEPGAAMKPILWICDKPGFDRVLMDVGRSKFQVLVVADVAIVIITMPDYSTAL